MDINKLQIVEMTPEYSTEIARWRYDGVYSVYNTDDAASFLDGTYYACVNTEGSLIGYFCFGAEARIPTVEPNVYEADFLDIGLGIRPNHCGNGLGITFLNTGLNYARKHLGAEKIRLSVAAFNDRAIKVYEKAGFNKRCEVTHSLSKNIFYVMTLIRLSLCTNEKDVNGFYH